MTEPLQQSELFKLPPIPGDWRVVTYASLADGSLAILGSDTDLLLEGGLNDRAMRRAHRAAATARARLWIFDGRTLHEGPTFPLLSPFPVVDRFRDGRWLVGAKRAGDNANARILDSAGRELRRLRLGDGINRLQIDEAGHIWVGWFDQGVFGNDSWRVPGLAGPPSSTGLAAFDEHGGVVAHAAEAPERFRTADCYALNVIGEVAWACTYTEFPIVSVGVGEPPRWWSTTLEGPRAIAVRPPYVLAAGGHGETGDLLELIWLGHNGGETVWQWRLPFPTGAGPEVEFLDGRGGALNIVRDGCWHRWQIDDVLR